MTLDILIIGAGICGLANAIALRRKGFPVRVYEQARSLSEIGAGIQVPPNAMRVLDGWGLMQTMMDAADMTAGMRVRRYASGEVLLAVNSVFGERVDEYPRGTVHRADYQRILYDAAVALGVPVSFKKHIVSVDIENVTITCEDGEVATADLIVAANGVRSSLRDAILHDTSPSTPPPPLIVDEIAYRLLIPRTIMLSNPSLSPLMHRREVVMWIGPGATVVTYAINRGQHFNVVMACFGGHAKPGVWSERVDAAEVHARYAGFEPTVHEMIDAAAGNILKWALPDMRPLERWSSRNGRVVLAGDAAHPTKPHMAQGATMAIEDAACLAECLSFSLPPSSPTSPTTTPLQTALQTYQTLRIPRTSTIQQRSRDNMNNWSLPDGPEQAKRDAAYRAGTAAIAAGLAPKERPKPDGGAPVTAPAFLEWVYGYDVVGEVEVEVGLRARI